MASATSFAARAEVAAAIAAAALADDDDDAPLLPRAVAPRVLTTSTAAASAVVAPASSRTAVADRSAGGASRQGAAKKHWCVTVKQIAPDPASGELGNLAGFKQDPLVHAYLIVGDETGAGGYKHWQCFVQYHNKVRMTAVKKFFGPTAHCESMLGTPQQVFKFHRMLRDEPPAAFRVRVNAEFQACLEGYLNQPVYGNARAMRVNAPSLSIDTLATMVIDDDTPCHSPSVSETQHQDTPRPRKRSRWDRPDLH